MNQIDSRNILHFSLKNISKTLFLLYKRKFGFWGRQCRVFETACRFLGRRCTKKGTVRIQKSPEML